MKRRLLSKKGWIAVVPAVLLIVVLGVGGAQQTVPELCSPLTQLYQYIDRSFYWQDKLQDTTLLHGAMRGMVEALDDPYSEFLDPQEWTRFVDALEGKLTGVGIEIAIVKNVLTVVAPLEGTPAEAAGIKAGDQILAIDGQTAEGITTSQASSKIRGEAGTTVVLHIRHKDGKEEDISIVRQEISVPAVRSELVDDGRIGYIRLSRFDSDAATEVNRALQSFDLNGLDGLILDLRNNTGRLHGRGRRGVELLRGQRHDLLGQGHGAWEPDVLLDRESDPQPSSRGPDQRRDRQRRGDHGRRDP